MPYAIETCIARDRPVAGRLPQAEEDDIDFAAGAYRAAEASRAVPIAEAVRAAFRPDLLPEKGASGMRVEGATNPAGVESVGESGTFGLLTSAMDAVAGALVPLGVDQLDIPATLERVWTAIRVAHGAGWPRRASDRCRRDAENHDTGGEARPDRLQGEGTAFAPHLGEAGAR